ncbi:hypothetical protein BCR34DRAFT_66437 [Clohesyomyces aquaticus]|uniref:Uncharacterized protein n=1 Tax=Clohesyomyces aquaticus TaxID=1231657 RepID=A0A1Y1Z0P4_9PLEO|nr:hypothetical protein BCR34DRAFT_66437 [Clohesyomyces aquaticus]
MFASGAIDMTPGRSMRRRRAGHGELRAPSALRTKQITRPSECLYETKRLSCSLLDPGIAFFAGILGPRSVYLAQTPPFAFWVERAHDRVIEKLTSELGTKNAALCSFQGLSGDPFSWNPCRVPSGLRPSIHTGQLHDRGNPFSAPAQRYMLGSSNVEPRILLQSINFNLIKPSLARGTPVNPGVRLQYRSSWDRYSGEGHIANLFRLVGIFDISFSVGPRRWCGSSLVWDSSSTTSAFKYFFRVCIFSIIMSNVSMRFLPKLGHHDHGSRPKRRTCA